MKEEVHKLLKRVGMIDGLLVLLCLLLLALISFKFVAMVILGIIIAYLNFAVNTAVTYFAMDSKGGGYGMYTLLSFVIRVAAVAGIGAAAFMYNKYFVMAYLLGYSLHFISLILYGTNAK